MLIAAPTIPGLVWAYHFKPSNTECNSLTSEASLQELLDTDGFVWLHLNLADARVASFLETLPGLPSIAAAALVTHETHASLTVSDQVVYGTLVDFQRDFDTNTRDLGWLHFAVCGHLIVTTRLQPLQSAERVRAAIEKNPSRYRQPMDILELIVTEFQRTLIALVMEVTEELNQIEDYVYHETPRDERRRLAPIRRTAVRLHRHLRTVLSLLRRAAAADEDDIHPAFEDVSSRLISRLESVDHDIYALQERARLLHEEIDSKLSSETNRHLYVLSLMTAFLLPPTLVTGFFGMNTGNLFFSKSDDGTMYAIGFIVLSILLAWWAVKKARIL
ncbi:transporter [Rhizobium oryzicola]|uniref:Transporter n=1 Tax=Rhizobium oryzicola TaxID=1232668 RepID=A0ABT8SS56_9HYPH|nr:transporter [Rhizobium oryzicola]MDO1581244.1 transporter [Rhizobium oryzicola]